MSHMAKNSPAGFIPIFLFVKMKVVVLMVKRLANANLFIFLRNNRFGNALLLLQIFTFVHSVVGKIWSHRLG